MINQDLYDRRVEHLIQTKRYSKSAEILLESAVARHQKRLFGLFKVNLKPDVTREVTRHVQELYDIGKSSISDFVGAEIDFHSNSLRKSVQSFYEVSTPDRRVIEAEILKGKIQFKDGATSGGNLADEVNSIGKNELLKLNQLIRRGIVAGKTKDDLIKEVMKTAKITEYQSKTLVQTTMTQSESLILERVGEANNDLVKGYMFTAILDTRTSVLCSSLHGTVMAANNIYLRPPLHWNCRSSLTMLLKGAEDIMGAQTHRVKPEKVPVAELPVDGIPAKEDFGAWLARQSMSDKVKYLGDEHKVALLEKGNLSFSEFFNNALKPISIGRLRVLDAEASFDNVKVRSRRLTGVPDVDLQTVDRPFRLTQSPATQQSLKKLIMEDSIAANQPLSLTDYRGTSLVGKRSVRFRADNELDPNASFNPVTGEVQSPSYYDPDFGVLRERIDFMNNSKVLTGEQKKFIEAFINGLEDDISVNQQSAATEALRVVIERYNRDKRPWDNFPVVLRNEFRYSVVNVSRILDRRSRERAQLFLKFSPDTDDAKVSILGEYRTFDEISNDFVDNQNYVRAWDKAVGRNLARKLYFSGDVPARLYLLPPRKASKIPYTFKEAEKLLFKELKKWAEENIPGVKLWKEYQNYKFGPLVFVDRIRNTVRAEIRNILDLQFLYIKDRRTLGDQLITNTVGGADQQVELLSHLLQVVAAGQSTDYDTIAIEIGKEIRKKWAYRLPWTTYTLEDYHADGSRILEGLKSQGVIRVQSRGVTKRGLMDLSTNRLGGPRRDTVSREVSIADKDLLGLQKANREIDIGMRIGVTSPSNRFYARPGQKTYFDAYGNNTGVPIITRSAYADFDPLQLDRDFANMLNHTMANQYVTDREFSSFFLDMARFRDPRGNTAYYDNLNTFKHIIIERGDLGYGLLESIKWHTNRAKPFEVIARIDSRGRVYYRGYLTPTGGEIVRPFIDSAELKPMTPGALKQLQTSVGIIIGPSDEAMTTVGRLSIFKRHEQDILEIGRLISANTQRDRRIREYLENPLVQMVDEKEMPKLARFALEYYRLHQHTNGNFDDVAKLGTYQTRLMAEADASASALQMITLATGDVQSAVTSNIVPTRAKGRIYDLVAQDTYSDPRFQAFLERTNLDLTWEDLSKAAKYQNMIALYGAGKAGQAARVSEELQKVLSKKGIDATTRAELTKGLKPLNQQINYAKAIGADDVVASLTSVKNELIEMVESGESISDALLSEAAEIHPDLASFLVKFENRRGPSVGPDDFKLVANIMSDKLGERVPLARNYINFWKKAGRTFVRETETSDVPWVTFDKKTLLQKYRPVIQKRIEFYDPISGRYVRNIYQEQAQDGKLLGKGMVGTAGLGLGVNGTHANDASIVRQFHLWGRDKGVQTSTIHDAVFTHISDLDDSIDELYNIYAKARTSDSMRLTLKAMKDAGLSDESYKALLKEAEEQNLLDGKLTPEMILQRPKPGEDRYGWGG